MNLSRVSIKIIHILDLKHIIFIIQENRRLEEERRRKLKEDEGREKVDLSFTKIDFKFLCRIKKQVVHCKLIKIYSYFCNHFAFKQIIEILFSSPGQMSC